MFDAVSPGNLQLPPVNSLIIRLCINDQPMYFLCTSFSELISGLGYRGSPLISDVKWRRDAFVPHLSSSFTTSFSFTYTILFSPCLFSYRSLLFSPLPLFFHNHSFPPPDGLLSDQKIGFAFLFVFFIIHSPWQ